MNSTSFSPRAASVGLAATCFATAMALSFSASAEDMKLSLGAKLGPNLNQLSQPNDPEGEPTVLFGTAFSGFGFTGGASAVAALAPISLGDLAVEADLLVSHHRGRGFAESRTSDARREIVIHTTMLRVPLLGMLELHEGGSGLRFGIGPELLLGFHSGSIIRQQGVSELPKPLHTTPVTHLVATTNIGFTYRSEGWQLPIDFRFTYDPFVAGSTRERFENFVSQEEPGEYRVAYDLQFLLLVGFQTDVM